MLRPKDWDWNTIGIVALLIGIIGLFAVAFGGLWWKVQAAPLTDPAAINKAIPNPSQVFQPASDPASLVVTSYADAKVYLVTRKTGTFSRIFGVEPQPIVVAEVSASRLIIAAENTKRFYTVNRGTGAVVWSTLISNASVIEGLCVQGSVAWVVYGVAPDNSGYIKRFNVDTGATIGIALSTGGKLPRGCSFSADGKTVFVANDTSSTVTAIDTASFTLKKTYTLPANSAPKAVQAVGNAYVVTANYGLGTLSRVRLSDNTVSTITLGQGTLSRPNRLASDGTKVFVTLSNAAKYVQVDPSLPSVTKTVSLVTNPVDLGLADAGVALYVTLSNGYLDYFSTK